MTEKVDSGRAMMDTTLKYMPLVLAVAFCSSAAYLAGEFFSAHQIQLLWLLTFSDYVNAAPAVIIFFGTNVLIFICRHFVLRNQFVQNTFFRRPPKKPRRRWQFTLLAVVGLLGNIAFLWFLSRSLPWLMIATFYAIVAVIAAADVILAGPLGRRIGRANAMIGIEVVVLLLLSFLGGAFSGFALQNGSVEFFGDPSAPIYTVHTKGDTKTADEVMPIDRGLIVIGDSKFDFIPWEEVKDLSALRRNGSRSR